MIPVNEPVVGKEEKELLCECIEFTIYTTSSISVNLHSYIRKNRKLFFLWIILEGIYSHSHNSIIPHDGRLFNFSYRCREYLRSGIEITIDRKRKIIQLSIDL